MRYVSGLETRCGPRYGQNTVLLLGEDELVNKDHVISSGPGYEQTVAGLPLYRARRGEEKEDCFSLVWLAVTPFCSLTR